MKEVFDVVVDLGSHILKRWLMIYLLRALVIVKDRFAGYEKWVEAGFVIFTTSFYVAVSYIPAVKKLLYGSEDGMLESRASILPMFISLLLMLLYCLYFYSGKKRNIIYLVFTFYTLNELTMFSLHSVFNMLIQGITTVLLHLVMEENQFIIRNFDAVFGWIQIIWSFSFHLVFFLVLTKVIGILKSNLSGGGRELNNIQELFLAVPSVMGFCFCILIRCIMYAYNGQQQVRFLMDEYPETHVLIPMVAGLCLLSVILSTAILNRLVKSSEKEMMVEVCQHRISDMEEHMKDVEHLYDGIRGMRHDMKNYVADMEILLAQENRAPGEYGQEMRRYLDGLCAAMEELDMKCNTGNPVTDVVISRKMRRAAQEETAFESNFIFPEKLGISAFDISIFLNNGLDNALEAAGKEKNPYIRLDSYIKGNMFFIEIRNSFTGSLHLDDGGRNLLTSKTDNPIHGLGIKNMKGCAEKYYGTLRWESRDGEFLLAIMLQGKENNV